MLDRRVEQLSVLVFGRRSVDIEHELLVTG
jgi:hypothetical protein